MSAIGKLAFAEDYPEIAETLLNEREVDPDNNDMPSVASEQEERKDVSAANTSAGTENTQSETSSAADKSTSKISEEAMAKKIMEGAAASSSNAQAAANAPEESAEGLEDMLDELI